MMYSLFVIFILLYSATGSFIRVENPVYKEKVVLGHFHHQIRQRRSGNEHGNFFPENIRMTFRIKGSLTDLNLQRRDFTNDHLIDTGSMKYRLTDHNILPDFAVYQNNTHDAAITMRCKQRDLDKCIVHGTFMENNHLYQINPVPEEISELIYEVNEIRYRRSASMGEIAMKQLEKKIKSEEGKVLTRKKRQSIVPRDSPLFTRYTVELAIWYDLTMYQKFLSLNSNDNAAAIADLNVYAIGLANEVDIRLRNIDQQMQDLHGLSFECSGQLTYVLICTNGADCVWSTNRVNNGIITYNRDSDIESFLLEFRDKKAPGSFSDVYTGITMYDVTQNNGNKIEEIGAYYFNNLICNSNEFVVGSVITAKDGSAGFNFAHFIYFHFGGYGDSVDSNCSTQINYVGAKRMRPASDDSTAINPWSWSVCGLTRLKNRIDSGVVNCLKNNRFSNAEFIAYHTDSYLGEVYSLNKQCELAVASTSSFCGTQQPDMCNQGMNCNDGSGNCVVSEVFPFTGTPCHVVGQYPEGYCYEGLCRFLPTTPAETTTVATTTTTATTTTVLTTTTTTPTTTATTTPTTTTATTTTTPTTTTTTATTTPTTTTATTTTTPTTATTTAATTTTTAATTTTTPTTTTTTTPTTTTATTTEAPTTATTTPTTATTTAATTTTTPTTATTTAVTTKTTPTTVTPTTVTTTTTPTTTTRTTPTTMTTLFSTTTSATPTGPSQGPTSKTVPTSATRSMPTEPTVESTVPTGPTLPDTSTPTTPKPQNKCLVPGGIPKPTSSIGKRISYKRAVLKPKIKGL